ncbi:hypothetical protein [Micromonospora aurantiaca (nom. illeg.)]|uniref:hypothetical protein n=1 Tax=Micromonospora aurantiaca (nom. illeg.) TaxID=47850 RepID=UPI0011ABD662|nr:hypothetical protein [Micromonospora aurantiaca]MBC9005173.1 hypothetical protein [Micromonospora aurantiaca]
MGRHRNHAPQRTLNPRWTTLNLRVVSISASPIFWALLAGAATWTCIVGAFLALGTGR